MGKIVQLMSHHDTLYGLTVDGNIVCIRQRGPDDFEGVKIVLEYDETNEVYPEKKP